MEKDVKNIIRELKQMILDEKDSLEVDKRLSTYNLPKEEELRIIQILQRFEIKQIEEKSKSSQNIIQLVFGFLLLILGLMITFGTYFSGSSQYVITFGFIAFGISLIIKGFTSQ